MWNSKIKSKVIGKCVPGVRGITEERFGNFVEFSKLGDNDVSVNAYIKIVLVPNYVKTEKHPTFCCFDEFES